MNLPNRLRRAEERLEARRGRLRAYPACRAPPRFPRLMVLVHDGFREGRPCPTCGQEGGAGALALDPDTGELLGHGPELILLGASVDEWLARNGGRSFDRQRDALMAWMRASRAGAL